MISSQKGPGDVAAEILMSRMDHSGSFLVVEGDDDSKFWQPRITSPECAIVIGGGKTAVVGSLERLDRKNFRGAVGIVDDDCDRLRGVENLSPNLVRTDTRDLEGLLLRSSAFFKVLAEFGDHEKICRFEERGESVRNSLILRALMPGKLRWLAYSKNVSVNFERLAPASFIDDMTWQLDESGLLDSAVELGLGDTRENLARDLSCLPAVDPWQVCQGHDLVDILGRGFRAVLGKDNPGKKAIARVLRSGVEKRELEGLDIYRGLWTWETGNRPFKILQ